MAAPKGHPKWGGRVKGTKNRPHLGRQALIDSQIKKATAELAAATTPEAMTPLEAILLCMHWAIDRGDHAAILAAATAAAPYCHARLAIADVRVTTTQAPMNEEQLAIEIATLEKRIAEAKRLN